MENPIDPPPVSRKVTGPGQQAWSDAVGEVLEAVSEKEALSAPERHGLRSRRSTVGFCLVTLAGLIAYNAWYFASAVQTLEVEVVRAEVMGRVSQLAKEAEIFRNNTGHLPQVADLRGLQGDGITYQVLGNHFRIGASDRGVAVSYHSSVDVEVWKATSSAKR